MDIGTAGDVGRAGRDILFGLPNLKDSMPHFLWRLSILLFIASIAYADKKYPGKIMSFVRNLYPLVFLSFFYAETGYMKNIIIAENLDVYFSGIDQYIWGFQPSLQFSQSMPHGWFNELMNISYIS